MTKALAGLLAVDVVLSILVTPAGGMDPRPPSGAHLYSWVGVGIYMLGLIASIGGVVQLLRGKPNGPTLAFGPATFYGVIILDRLGLFHAEAAPPVIVTLEWSVAGLSAVVLALAVMVRKGAATASK